MAFTLTSLTPERAGFAQHITGDLSGCEDVLAAPGAGKYIVLEGFLIHTEGNVSVTLGEGETDGAATAAVVGPVKPGATQTVAYTFPVPVRLAANTALTIDASAGTLVTAMAFGRVV